MRLTETYPDQHNAGNIVDFCALSHRQCYRNTELFGSILRRHLHSPSSYIATSSQLALAEVPPKLKFVYMTGL